MRSDPSAPRQAAGIAPLAPDRGETHAGHGEHGLAGAPFSDSQLQQFREDDKHAGGAVVVLMTAIFTIGLILYSIVLGLVIATPHHGL